MINFEDKNVLITGAANGIGRNVAEKMADAGASLFLLDQDIQALNELKHLLSIRTERRIDVYHGDVADSDYIQDTVGQIATGDTRLHHVIHCAGIYPDALMEDTTNDLWRMVMAINADSTFYLCRAVVPHLAQNSSIVAITSLAAHRGNLRHSHYSASKGAVASFCKSIALELAPHTRVNVIAPGMIQTKMTEEILNETSSTLRQSTPLKRVGLPGDVANVAMFLCSELAGFITGETIHVNGGLYIA